MPQRFRNYWMSFPQKNCLTAIYCLLLYPPCSRKAMATRKQWWLHWLLRGKFRLSWLVPSPSLHHAGFGRKNTLFYFAVIIINHFWTLFFFKNSKKTRHFLRTAQQNNGKRISFFPLVQLPHGSEAGIETGSFSGSGCWSGQRRFPLEKRLFFWGWGGMDLCGSNEQTW